MKIKSMFVYFSSKFLEFSKSPVIPGFLERKKLEIIGDFVKEIRQKTVLNMIE